LNVAVLLVSILTLADAQSALLGRAQQARASVDAMFFGPQRAFVEDTSPFKTGCTSRRAGKSEGAAGALLDSGNKRHESVNLYITLSRINAKRIIWRRLKAMAGLYVPGSIANESELCIQMPNGSTVYLAGAKDRGEIEKFRGLGLGRVVLDEAQTLPAYIEELIDDVIEPGLMDFDGDLILTGTPAPVPVGYFYRATRNLDNDGKPLGEPMWSNHAWTVFDNPHILRKSGKTPQQHLERALKRRGVTVEDPGIQREFFGRWAYDPNALVFRYNPAKNGLVSVPSGEWDTVIGVDLGFDDADAVAVLGFARNRPEAHLREEVVTPKQTITQLAERLTALIEKHKPLAVVMDTGGLGKKIAEEIRKRHALPIEAAEKARKFEHIELLNDAMRSGRFFAKPDSRFAQDCMLVEWDREKSKNDKLVISERYHSDICDAVLYAFRKSLHWLHAPEKPGPVYGSPEWAAKEDAEMEEYALEQQEEQERAQKEMDEWL
jgi:hypothetical protein